MESMKAIAEIHSKAPPASGPAADTTSPVITEQPSDAETANMDDINLNANDSFSADATDGKSDDNVSDGIELKDMLNTSRDDSGISGDLITTDLGGQSEDTDQNNHNANNESADHDQKQNCDIQNIQTSLEPIADVHETNSSENSEKLSKLNLETNESDKIKPNNNETNEQSNQSNEDNTATTNAKTEEVSSITSDGSKVTNLTTGSETQPASLDIDLSLDGISTCSFDPEAEVPDERSIGDGKMDEVSLVDVKVEVKDEMALLSKAITEVQQEDGKVFEAKVKYQRELREARLKLYRMYKTYRQAIEKTKPYYVAKELEKEMKAELDQTETDAERAKLNFEAAKETEAIAMEAMSSTKAEHGSIGSQGCEGREALENWNQATARVLETSKLRAEIEDRLRRKEEQFLQAERSANALFLDLRKLIERAWPYYAMKDQYARTLEKTRKEIRESGKRLAAAKEQYQETFSRLNLVATEIHQRKTINDRQSGIGANDNFSQFEEIHDIDTVLSNLESKAENLSTCLDGLDDDEEGDIEAELTIMPKSKSLFSIGRSNTRESLDELVDPKKVMGEKSRRKTLAQINY